MSYHLLKYFAFFLPIAIIAYQVTPKKFRWITLLIANYTFFCLICNVLVVYLLFSTLSAYYTGLWLKKVADTAEGTSKEITAKKRKVLAVGILSNLLILIVLKYFNFFGQSIADLLNVFSLDVKFSAIKFLVPIGISYYTLQVISYLMDIYRGTIQAERNLAKVALYLSFFPQIMEGPISRFNQVADDLYSGEGIKFDNLKFGYQRIVWGLFKKIVVADRVAAVVGTVFDNYADYDGSIIVVGVLCFTCQLYMEFSGCMDIVIGSGQIFGIRLPENFRQPFLAKDASDFWHRWHITLGTWFKDYIFYTVSLAKPVKNFAKKVKEKFGKNVSKFAAPTIALLCVWSCNGLWHGAKWTYIFYGMFYFVIIFIENIFEEPVRKLADKSHINRESMGYRIFRIVKLFIIINIGEMFFRADTVKDGFIMLGRIFSDFHISQFLCKWNVLGMDRFDVWVAIVGIAIVFAVGILKEKNIQIRESIAKWVLPARWILWYAIIVFVVVFGAYGAGYDNIAMIYAGY